MVADLHEQSFFVTRFASGSEVSETILGTRPGEALSDLVFTYVYHMVLERVQAKLQTAGYLEQIPFDDEQNLWEEPTCCWENMLGPTWADDSAFVVSDAVPRNLRDKVQGMAEIVVNEMTGFGLEPNFKKGKTEGAGMQKSPA